MPRSTLPVFVICCSHGHPQFAVLTEPKDLEAHGDSLQELKIDFGADLRHCHEQLQAQQAPSGGSYNPDTLMVNVDVLKGRLDSYGHQLAEIVPIHLALSGHGHHAPGQSDYRAADLLQINQELLGRQRSLVQQLLQHAHTETPVGQLVDADGKALLEGVSALLGTLSLILQK